MKRLRPAQYLRKEFRLESKAASAVITATSHGLYRLWINGKRVGHRVLTPEVTPFQSWLTCQTYDVTDLLQQGGNVIGAVLTDG